MSLLPRSLGGRALALALCLAALAAALWTLPVRDLLAATLDWVRLHPLAGPALYVLVVIVGSVLLVPGSVLVMAGGFLFGVLQGWLLVSVAVVLGATAALLVGRGLGRDWAARRLQDRPRLRALDAAVRSRGLLVVTLTRMSMLLPYNLLNYAYGLSSVGLRDYMLGTWLGMLPVLLLYVYLGSLVRNIDQLLRGDAESGPVSQALLVLGLVAALAVVVVVHRTATRLLTERMPEA